MQSFHTQTGWQLDRNKSSLCTVQVSMIQLLSSLRVCLGKMNNTSIKYKNLGSGSGVLKLGCIQVLTFQKLTDVWPFIWTN